MTPKTIPIIIVLLALCVIGASVMAFVTGIPRPSSSHQAIINDTTVKIMVHSELTATTKAVCIDARHATVEALSCMDFFKRATWFGQDMPFSVWSFEYGGHPIGYMQIWGPHEGWFYVQFSKASMTTMDVDVMGETVTLPATTTDPPQEGLWWTWIEAS